MRPPFAERKKDLVVVKWQDKIEVTILTSAHDPTKTSSITTRNVIESLLGSILGIYQELTTMTSSCPLARRTAKWTTKLFMYFLTLPMIQASTIYNKISAHKHRKTITVSELVVQLGTSLSQYLRTNLAEPRITKSDFPFPGMNPTSLPWFTITNSGKGKAKERL
ncbi:PiggyBac transposable element-derived protein 4 [Plakobranchus ocellatus]|uniref:PiggyBac transposable element-derived protein 4 n=1 Tax=Plakobranchus ocellatus TaxID=259542 RepID=A0AAV4DL17_9GAST|nr:PiggyBac transposable element-derived protein 4 [Plakobranchus ocellatus]